MTNTHCILTLSFPLPSSPSMYLIDFLCRFEGGKDGPRSPLNCTFRLALFNWKPRVTSSCTQRDSVRLKIFTIFYKYRTTVENTIPNFLHQRRSLWPNITNNSLNCFGFQKTIFFTHLLGISTTCYVRNTTRV